MDKKTLIICTISDRMCDEPFIRALYERGMNIVRINSAHSTPEGAQMIVDTVRNVSDNIGILVDTKGPEIRLTDTDIPDGIKVREGETIEFHNDVDFLSSHNHLNTNCATLVNDVPVGASILIDDGSICMTVIDKDNDRLVCRILNSGIIKGKKSVNIPDVHISLPALTERDAAYVRWAIDQNLDYLAHSFVRNAQDLDEINHLIGERRSEIKVISKIENQQGIDNIDGILEHSHGIMIARGDLGVEVPLERLPVIQRKIVHKCHEKNKMVIIATQMLHTMIENPRPTRAEVSDVANAIYQHVSAVMLSGETASGTYPLEAVHIMGSVILQVESSYSLC
jgi:pyruvate kinase